MGGKQEQSDGVGCLTRRLNEKPRNKSVCWSSSQLLGLRRLSLTPQKGVTFPSWPTVVKNKARLTLT